MRSQDLYDFCNRHYISIVDTNNRIKYSCDPRGITTGTYMSHQIVTETETLYTIQIPEDKLEFLVLMEQFLFNGTSTQEMRGSLGRYIAINRREEALRHSNPAVMKAYEKYKTLLDLCKNSEDFD